jgi:hypothetical protein
MLHNHMHMHMDKLRDEQIEHVRVSTREKSGEIHIMKCGYVCVGWGEGEGEGAGHRVHVEVEEK